MNLNNPLTYILISIALFLLYWFLKRFLKSRGKIRCTISELSIEFHEQIDKFGESKTCNFEKADVGFYNIKLDFFNEKDVQIALRNPSVIFERKDKKNFITQIRPHNDNAEGIDLPSRKLIHYSWSGSIDNIFGELDIAIKADKTFFVGYLPNGREVKKVILKEPLYNQLGERSRYSIKINK